MQAGPRIYNMFPLLAGSVPQWIAHLPRIAAMGFHWVYLNPFHYPGFSGSLYAIKDLDRLHPVVQGDSGESPDHLLRRFTTAAAEHGVKVMLDLVINHTAKDALLAGEHPEWYLREADGSLRSPRAIDPADARKVTVWGDLAELDYHDTTHRAAQLAYWTGYVKRVLALGFRGFRCDAAYQVPAAFWDPLIGAARAVAPDCLFCAETLGCKLEQTAALARAGFDLLFNSSKYWDFHAPWLLEQYDAFRRIAPSIAFPESHDTPRLAAELAAAALPAADPARLERAYRLRYLFAATFSTGVMMPMGYEYGAARRLHVITTRPEDWTAETVPAPRFDLTGFIAAVNAMKAVTPTLNVEGKQMRLSNPGMPWVALLRFDAAEAEMARHVSLSLINPTDAPAEAIDVASLLEQMSIGWDAFTEITPGAAGEKLAPAHSLTLEPLQLRIFAARHR